MSEQRILEQARAVWADVLVTQTAGTFTPEQRDGYSVGVIATAIHEAEERGRKEALRLTMPADPTHTPLTESELAAIQARGGRFAARTDIPRLLADLAAARGEIERGREQATKASRYVIACHNSYARDHACGQCVPGGDMVDPDFTCAYHEAVAWMQGLYGCSVPQCAEPGPHRGPSCRNTQGFTYASDVWCNCKCHTEPTP